MQSASVFCLSEIGTGSFDVHMDDKTEEYWGCWEMVVFSLFFVEDVEFTLLNPKDPGMS